MLGQACAWAKGGGYLINSGTKNNMVQTFVPTSLMPTFRKAWFDSETVSSFLPARRPKLTTNNDKQQRRTLSPSGSQPV